MYLLRYDGGGEPIAYDSSSVSDFGYDKVDMEEEVVVAGTEAVSKSDEEVASVAVEQKSVKTVSSSDESSSLESVEEIQKRQCSLSMDSISAMLNIGNCFCTRDHDSVWKIKSFNSMHVTAQLISG
ncbi:hypothetical protein ACA910_021550 [Epithemia clementina (nom. ined.)]